MSPPYPCTQEVTFPAHQIFHPETDTVCDERLRALMHTLHRALKDASSVTLRVETSEMQQEILQRLSDLLRSGEKPLWGTTQDDALILRKKAPRLSWDTIRRQLHGHAGGLKDNPDTLLQRDDQCWEEHLKYTQSHLRDEMKHQRVKALDPQTNERRIRGRSAEFILQMTLERFAETFSKFGYPVASLVDRSRPLILPQAPNGNAYRWHPTTFHNGELKASQLIGNTHQIQRHRPQQQSNFTMTEVDAAITTDLYAEDVQYGTLYLFDGTTSISQLREKVLTKVTKIMPFIEDMQDAGVRVEMVNVLLSDKPCSFRSEENALDKRVRSVTLPLSSLVDDITKRTATELNVPIPSY